MRRLLAWIGRTEDLGLSEPSARIADRLVTVAFAFALVTASTASPV